MAIEPKTGAGVLIVTLMALFSAWFSVFLMCAWGALPKQWVWLVVLFMAALFSAATALDKCPFRTRRAYLASMAAYLICLAATMVLIGLITARSFGLSPLGWY